MCIHIGIQIAIPCNTPQNSKDPWPYETTASVWLIYVCYGMTVRPQYLYIDETSYKGFIKLNRYIHV